MNKSIKIIGMSVAGLVAVTAPFIVTTLLLTAPIVLTTGCGILGPATNSQAAIDASAAILQNTARTAAIAAITPPTGNTNNVVYFNLASQAIGTFLTGTDYSPGAFQAALLKINAAPQLSNVWVQLAVGGVIDLYEVYFAQYVNGQVNANAYSQEFLLAVQTGFNQALGPVYRKTIEQRLPANVLPRPLK